MELNAQQLNVMDILVLKNLQKIGRKTKLQLMQKGVHSAMVNRLEEVGVLIKEHDPATNLNYYTVNNDCFDTGT